MATYAEMDSVRQQLESFRFPSPTPTIRSHKIWSGQHLEPYLPSPRSLSPSPSARSYFDSNFVDSAYASPSMEEAPLSPTTRKAMTLQDTLSELESIVRKYEVDEPHANNNEEEEPKSFWEDDSDEEDEDYDFIDEAYDSGCFTEDDESFETRLASLQPPTKKPRLSEEEPKDCHLNITATPGVTIVKPSAGLRLSKRMRMKRRQLSIPRSMPAGLKSPTGTGSGDWWLATKPSPAFIDMFQF
ncbi:hypothetical protein ABW20_dc0109006 [Dactylellina cionopaga]|nr:hypothetical protein ABW20_dc0109006 [Dactylellina cionopaga]